MSMEIKDENIIEKEYFDDLKKIKKTINSNQNKAVSIVNATMIFTYYEIGKIILNRKTWGNKYLERLSLDLKEHGSGYSRSNLFYILLHGISPTQRWTISSSVKIDAIFCI